MIGQLPPFALATPAFRFRALAACAGRAALGGGREVAMACFAIARLGAAMLPPVLLAPADAATRGMSTKYWLAALALPAPARTAGGAAIDAITTGNRRNAARAIEQIADVASPQLDQGALAELHDLAADLRD